MPDEPTRLVERRCEACDANTPVLDEERVREFLAELPGWERVDGGIERGFEFRGFGRTMGFVNAVAWVAMKEGHHPDLQVGYNRCRVRWTTHAIGGLSENDFICAAKVDALLA